MDSEKKYVINLGKLLPGDIILSTFNTQLSKIMEYKTGCKYHHAQFYFRIGSYIHSYEEGVQSANPMRDLYEQQDDMVILRLKKIEDRKKIPTAINFVQTKIGTEYSNDEMMRVLSAGEIASIEENRQICTRLVAQAYAAAGVDLVSNPDYCSLQDLIKSEKVEVIHNALRLANAMEVKYALEEGKGLNSQKKATNEILATARNITKEDIQSLTQLEKFIVANPQFDIELTQVVIDSGYLDTWKAEMERNPQDYDFERMVKYYPIQQLPEVIEQCSSTAFQNIDSYKIGLEEYKLLFEKHPLKYIKVHIELLGNLIQMFEKMRFAIIATSLYLNDYENDDVK